MLKFEPQYCFWVTFFGCSFYLLSTFHWGCLSSYPLATTLRTFVTQVKSGSVWKERKHAEFEGKMSFYRGKYHENQRKIWDMTMKWHKSAKTNTHWPVCDKTMTINWFILGVYLFVICSYQGCGDTFVWFVWWDTWVSLKGEASLVLEIIHKESWISVAIIVVISRVKVDTKTHSVISTFYIQEFGCKPICSRSGHS